MEDYKIGERLSEKENLSAMMLVMEYDPFSFEKVVKSEKWRESMSAKIEAIERNHTRELTMLPKGATPIRVKWVFKTKLNEEGNVEKFKVRLVAKRYAQCPGIDYIKVFAQMEMLDIIRVILAI